MTVADLIEKLKEQPPQAVVEMGYRGAIASVASVVYWPEDRNGRRSVMLMHPLTGPMVIDDSNAALSGGEAVRSKGIVGNLNSGGNANG